METLEQKNINSQFFFMVMLRTSKNEKKKSAFRNTTQNLSENEFQ